MKSVIGIMGTPVSSGNRGVLALGASLVDLCHGANPHVDVVLFLVHGDKQPASFRVSGIPTAIQVVNCRMSPRSGLRNHLGWVIVMSIMYRILPFSAPRSWISRQTPWIRELEKMTVVGDIRGGDSFSDIYGMQRFILGFLVPWSVILVKGSIIHFPQTYGPYKRSVARWLARYLLNRSSAVIARDTQSQRIAQELIGPTHEVVLCPDVAFSLEVVRPEHVEFDPPLNPLPLKVIGLNVNGLMFNGGYSRKNMFGLKLDYPSFLTEFVTRLLEEHDGELWLIPHTFAPNGSVESDQEASRKLRESVSPELQSRVRIVSREYDQHEIKGVIGMCDFFVGSRMHACIAALSQGIPCVGVAYSMKFEGVFDSVGMGEWVVDGRVATNTEAVERILELYRCRDVVRAPLAAAADAARARLQEVFRSLVATSQ